MSIHDREKLDRLEDLKSKLFNKNYETKIEHRDNFPHFRQMDVVDSWEEREKLDLDRKEDFFMKTSMFKKFFIFSISFFVLAMGYALYVFFADTNSVSNDNINISILSNAFTAGGEEYPLLLEIANKNSSPLLLADLVVEYPKSSQMNLSEDNERIRLSLGTIPSGGVKNENVKFVIFGEQGSIRPIKISLEYRVEGSNSIFVKEKFYEVSISSTPINISIDAPKDISTNQDITLNIKSTLNATKPVSKMLLKVDYPIGFQFIKADPSPSSGNNIWNMGDLAPGVERGISITGKMVDVFDGEEKLFRVWSGSQDKADKSMIGVVFNSAEHMLSVRKSSIEAKIFVNGVSDREYAVDTKTPIQGQIQWRNNLDTKINNFKIVAKISGNAVNRKTISSRDGYYNSSQDIIVWDVNSEDKFKEISPGDSGDVSFSFSPLSLYSSSQGMISSPTAEIEVSVYGEQMQDGGINTELSAKETKIVRIISDLGLSTKALYYSGAFKNTGPIPPKAEQKTTFNIVWSLSNTANNISKAQVRATIPSWVRFVGTFSPSAEDLVYNPSTKEIVWNIGKIGKGTGITENGRNVSFQLELLPSSSQVGTTPVLINDATLTGHDDFANVDVRVIKSALDTKLSGDTKFPIDGSKVVE